MHNNMAIGHTHADGTFTRNHAPGVTGPGERMPYTTPGENVLGRNLPR